MVRFTLPDDPQEYTLKFDFNELADAEGVVGLNLLAAIAEWPDLTCRQFRGLLYALLKPGHPQVLVVEAGGLLTKAMQQVIRAMATELGMNGILETPAAAAESPVIAAEAGAVETANG